MEVSPAGGKWWRWKYRHLGKEKRLSLGTYPDTGLADARSRRDDARKLLAAGVDPGEHRKAAKAASQERAGNSFEVVGREWFAKQRATWVASQGSLVTKCALKLAPLLFVRPGELRHAEWSEIDLEGAQWNIPAEKMKMREPHLVPLASQAVEILRELQPLTGGGRYVFPSARSPKRPMSDNAVLSSLRRMGFAKDEMTGHGFRAMARTILDETLQFRPDYIEHQLAHAVRDPNGRAYNRTAFLPERRKMMQEWADYLSRLKSDLGHHERENASSAANTSCERGNSNA